MPKIKFHIDYEEDLENILFRITSFDPAGLDYRIEKKGLDEQVIKNVLKTDKPEEQIEMLDEYLRTVYKEIKPNLKSVKEKYEKIWKSKNDKFFKITTKLMGDIPWDFNEYLFLVSAFYSLVSWGQNNELAVWWKRSPGKYYFMNGYELILCHFFETIDHLYKKRPISDWHLWALAEITAHILTYKEERMISILWPHMNTLLETQINKDFKKGSYPQLAPYSKKVYELYNKSSNYPQFVKKSLDYISKYSKKELT